MCDLGSRFGRFTMVGAVNTALTLAIFNVLIAAGMRAAFANAVGYGVGIINSFAMNRRWTFADRRHLPIARTLPRFVAVNLIGLALTTGLVAAGVALASRVGLLGPGSDVIVLNAIELGAIGLGLISNFTLSHLWAFGESDGGVR